MTPEARQLKKINWAIVITLGILGISLGSILELFLGSRISPFLAPHPDELFRQLVETPTDWIKAAAWTALMSLIASVISVVLGSVLGFWAAYKRMWSVDCWAQLICSIPLIAIATYLLLAVGYGWAYGLSLAVFLGFFPVEKHVFDYCSTRSEGVNSISASFGLSRRQEFLHLRLAGAFRAMGTALSQSLPLCFIGETMGEYTSGKISPVSIGLGGHLRYAQNYSEYPRLWMAIILMMLLVYWSGEGARILWSKKFPLYDQGDIVQ